MRKTTLQWVSLFLLAASALGGVWAEGSEDVLAPETSPTSPRGSTVVETSIQKSMGIAYGKLTLSFELNEGQTDEQVKFLSRGSGYTLFLTPTEAVLALMKPEACAIATARRPARQKPRRHQTLRRVTVLRMRLVGSDCPPQVEGHDLLPGKSHYFIGSDPGTWRTNVPHYSRVRYPEVYPGIDLIYYGSQGQLEYDFVVSPGADPRSIRLRFDGSESLSLDKEGNLILYTRGGEVVQRAPIVYQEARGGRKRVPGRYVLQGEKEVGFEVATYNPARVLVIDPVISYSTYLGGSRNDKGYAIAVDSEGCAYVTGTTTSEDFPTEGSVASYSGYGDDVFVTKLNPTGAVLIYSTYLGGNNTDDPWGIAIDGAGSAYIAGTTASSNYPRWPPFPPGMGFPSPYQYYHAGGTWDAFVSKLSPNGSLLLYSTYLGGSSSDNARDIAVSSSGNAYVTGKTSSTDFPIAPRVCVPGFNCPFQTQKAGPAVGGGADDAFITMFNEEGDDLVFSTYLGGNDTDRAHGIDLDAAGNVYVTGETESTNFPTENPLQPSNEGKTDAFVTRLFLLGTQLIYSTYLGGSEEDYAWDIAVDSSGNAYITGGTISSDFPAPIGAFDRTHDGGIYDAFIAKLNAGGNTLAYSAFLGGGGEDYGFAVDVDSRGCAYVTGRTSSLNFPAVNAVQPNKAGPSAGGSEVCDAFVSKVNPDGLRLLYSTYLGGDNLDAGRGIAVAPTGDAYVTGYTTSSNFPLTPGLFCMPGVTCPYQGSRAGLEDTFVTRTADRPADLRVLEIGRTGETSITITWRSEENRTYSIMAKYNLMSLFWDGLMTGIVADDETTTWTHTRVGGEESRFYRIGRTE